MWQKLERRKRFSELSEQEVLALAISSEEDDCRIFRAFAERVRSDSPRTAEALDHMAEEEEEHRQRLAAMYGERFGEPILLLRREHVTGFLRRRPIWLSRNLGFRRICREAGEMERRAGNFYESAARLCTDDRIRRLLEQLAEEERKHEGQANALIHAAAGQDAEGEEEARRRLILTWIQPGVAGLMDGSVSTLAPIFATAFATYDTSTTFLVGLAASVGAGISMGFTEAASDDGRLSGRGSPIKRGIASGVMTTIGGLGHALPYLIDDFVLATSIAIVIVLIELWAIAWIQNKFMETPFWRAALQVVLGGALVFSAGILIGSA